MTVIRWSGFAGESRAPHPKYLPDGVCAVLRNAKPGRGDLRPWRNPLTVATVPAGRKTIYRMGRDVASDADYWLSWPTVVHAIRGFSADDTTEQTFYTGDGPPKVTNNLMALAAAPYPTTSRPMGIPAPSTPLTAAKDAGTWTGDAVTYVYTYTFVNDWGWESAPAPESALHVRESDATSTLSAFAAAPAGNYAINRIRVYRSQKADSGKAGFFMLRELAYGMTSMVDDELDALNDEDSELLVTFNPDVIGSAWLPAPDDLSHLIALWNGMAAGISGNSVRFSVAYAPHAWPIAYDAIPPNAQPVALGVAGQNLLVLTNGRPMVLSGTSPDSMDQMPVEFSQACISPESVASMGAGVAWASNDGLCWWGPSTGPRIVTDGLMTREQWLALNPETIIGKMYEGLYFGTYDDGGGRKAFMIAPLNPAGIYFMDAGYEAMHFDELQDQLYVLSGTNVQRFDAAATFMTTLARSKEYRLTRPENFGYLEVTADAYPVTVFVDCMNIKPEDVTKLVTVDPRLTAPTPTSVRSTTVVQDRNPTTLPGGWLADDWQIEMSTAGAVQGIAMATSIEELAQT